MPTDPARPGSALLPGYSLEMTGKDVPGLEEAAPVIDPGTRINVTFLGNEDLPMRVNASAAVRRLGFEPVPHISARRIGSDAELREFLSALAGADAARVVFAVGGDPAEPMGPFPDSLSLIRTGAFAEAGVEEVDIAGYPDGHPDIAADVLERALLDKSAALAEQGLTATIITQFGFDEAPVLRWIERIREQGVTWPVRIGVPGPAGVKRLIGYARRFGVASSAGIVQKYGFSLANLLGTAGPGKFLDAFAAGYDPGRHGEVQLHFYTFGGLRATAEWIASARAS